MTKKLEQVVQRVSQLPEREQEAWAALFLEELDADRKWDESFARSMPQLKKMAQAALEEFKAGKATPLTSSRDLPH